MPWHGPGRGPSAVLNRNYNTAVTAANSRLDGDGSNGIDSSVTFVVTTGPCGNATGIVHGHYSSCLFVSDAASLKPEAASGSWLLDSPSIIGPSRNRRPEVLNKNYFKFVIELKVAV